MIVDTFLFKKELEVVVGWEWVYGVWWEKVWRVVFLCGELIEVICKRISSCWEVWGGWGLVI